MEKKMFKQFSDTEKRAKLAKVLINKTKGKLTKKEISTIVNSIDIDTQYKVIVITNPKEFGEKITLINYITKHSWAGSDGKIEKAEVIIGKDIKFGEDYQYVYYDNGNLDTDDKIFTQPDFDISSKYVVLIKCHNWYKWENTYPKYDNYNYTIIIYLPEKDYEIEPQIQYIIDNILS